MELFINTSKSQEVIDITEKIEILIPDNNPRLCNIFLTHTTAALTTADLDPGTDTDLLNFLNKIKPELKYNHPHNPEHAPDHILSSVIGTTLTIPIIEKGLNLGNWQRVVLIEFDGPKKRKILINFIQ